MITQYKALKDEVESELERQYLNLAKYSTSEERNDKAVYARKKMLDIFAQGWNSAEEYIQALEDERDHYRALLRARPPTQAELQTKAGQMIRKTIIHLAGDLRADQDKENARLTHLNQIKKLHPELY